MPKQDSAKVFRMAFNKMLEKYFPRNIGKIATKTQVGQQTIRDFSDGTSSIIVSNLEKILLDEIVSDEALDFFFEEVTKLLKYYRNYPYAYQQNEETVDENAELEDVLLGGSQGRKNLSKSSRTVTPENFQRNKEIMDSIGHEGEECVNAYLQRLRNEGKIKDFHWVSQQNVISPYDFWVSHDGNSKTFIDVKSTSGEFERKIHISLSELEMMSSDTERYDIYRIFNVDKNKKTARLRIAEEIRIFAKGIIEVFKSLPEGVYADGISVDLSKSGLNFQPEIEIQLPDEPEKESEEEPEDESGDV